MSTLTRDRHALDHRRGLLPLLRAPQWAPVTFDLENTFGTRCESQGGRGYRQTSGYPRLCSPVLCWQRGLTIPASQKPSSRFQNPSRSALCPETNDIHSATITGTGSGAPRLSTCQLCDPSKCLNLSDPWAPPSVKWN